MEREPHAEPDLSGGLHCIALYHPLRSFYCDPFINEYLSVCSRELVTMPLQVFKDGY